MTPTPFQGFRVSYRIFRKKGGGGGGGEPSDAPHHHQETGVFEQVHTQHAAVYALKPPYYNTCADLKGGGGGGGIFPPV